MTPAQGAATLRRAVAALSSAMPVEPGEIVSAAGAERTAALAEKLERPDSHAGVFDDRDLETLDSWIRLADSFTLHDDAAEATARETIGRDLRAVRAIVAPDAGALSEDPRDA